MASPETTTPPPRRSLGSSYACTACNGEGILDEGRFRELTETPGPLFLSLSQRPTADGEGTPPYTLTVTSKNAKRERERRRREEIRAAGGVGREKRKGAKRLKSAQYSIVDDSQDDACPTEHGNDDVQDEAINDQVNDRVNDQVNDQVNNQVNDQVNDGGNNQVNKQAHDQAHDQSDSNDGHDDSDNANDDGDGGPTLQPPLSPPPQRESSTHSSPSSARMEQPASTSLSAPTSTPIEEIGTGVVRSDRAEAEALLRLGLGKDEPTSAVREKILDVVFAVAGPAAMEDILGLCRRWREGLIDQTRQDMDRKTAALRAEWDGRLPEGDQKSAIVTVHVSAYWALSDDSDDFVRSIVRRRRLADFHEAFEELLRPKTKPNPGWKTKHAEVMRTRLAEAHPKLDPSGPDYRQEKERLRRHLRFGERWARLRREFGHGIFALLPSEMVTNKWVERTLSVTQFDTWLRVLKHHNRPDSTIVDRVGQLVGKALDGEQPPMRLRLEVASSADIARDCYDPAILFPTKYIQEEDDLFASDGAFLNEIEVT